MDEDLNFSDYLKNFFGFGETGTGFFGSPGAGLIGGIGSALLTGKGIKDLSDAQKAAMKALTGSETYAPAGGLMNLISAGSTFKPFTVTGPTGATSTVGAGSTTASLSPEEKALYDTLTGFASDAFTTLGSSEKVDEEVQNVIGMLTQSPADRATRETDIFNKLENMLQPERDRAQLALEERLAGQGRLGVQTAMYGGTPEQLALAKAIQEQKAGSAVSAIEQARQEQALESAQTLSGLQEGRARLGLLGTMGLNALTGAYTPQNQLLAFMQPQLNAANIAAQLQATGLGLEAGLGESAIESMLGFSALKNALTQQQYQGLFDLLGAQQSGSSDGDGTNLGAGLLDYLEGKSLEDIIKDAIN